jgi:predicted molibdopterin-dependent oxidoreductase YjgC
MNDEIYQNHVGLSNNTLMAILSDIIPLILITAIAIVKKDYGFFDESFHRERLETYKEYYKTIRVILDSRQN